MANNRLTIGTVATQNIKSNKFRSIGLILLVSVLSFILLTGTVLAVSLNNGLISLRNRLGADIMVVPVGYDGEIEAMLLKGEPCTFYLDKEIVNTIRQIEGVRQVSYQFYFVSVGADCCDLPVQIIGYDPDTDFTVSPWISQVYNSDSEENTLVVGSAINVGNANVIRLYGRDYKVFAQLQKTGTGLDYAVFANLKTLKDIITAAEEKGYTSPDAIDPQNQVSTVFVDVEDGYEISLTSLGIRNVVDSINTVSTESMISVTTDIMRNLMGIIRLFIVIVAILVVVTLIIVFSSNINERKKELAIYRCLGASRKYLSKLVLTEAFLISVSGAAVGIVTASCFVFPFSDYISKKLGLPYLQPSFEIILLIILLSFLAASLSGPVSATWSAYHISRADTYFVWREGE